MYWSFTFILHRVWIIDLWNLLSYQCATTEPYTKQSGQDKKIDHEKNQCGHHMETSRKTVYWNQQEEAWPSLEKCQERLETLCDIEEREKIKIKMKRICKVWPTGESRTLPTLTREKPWTNINGPSCGRGRGGGSTKRARESIIAYKITKQ